MDRSTKLPVRTRVMFGLVLSILVAPIATYVSVFGTLLSTSHQRWGEMGSAMSGIYSPLLALLALLVVYRQLKSQNRFNEHEIDQRYIEQSRSDIQYYLEQLDRVLQVKDPNGATVRQMLHQHFQPAELANLQSAQLIELARSLNYQYPQPLSLWSAIYPIVAGLQAPKRIPFEHNAVSALQKMTAMATFETAVALDNFHYCLAQGRANFPYQFSPLLRNVQ